MKPKHFILSLLALLVSTTTSAYTWTDVNGTVWNFTLSGGNATLTSGTTYKPCVSGNIPETLIVPSSVYIGETAYPVTTIGDSAFNGCSDLTSITIPDGVTSIGFSAIGSCSSLISVNIPSGVISIDRNAFWGCSSLTSINIPNSVTSIGNNAFRECSSLTSITIPNSVTFIGDAAFQVCSSLTSINIPDGVTSIGNSAFQNCSSLTSVTIPNGVTAIGNYAFQYCSSLTSITIGEGVTSIGNWALSNCDYLTSILFTSSTPKVTFSWPNGAILYVPDEAVEAYKAAWTSYASRIVPETSFSYIYTVDVTANESSSAVVEAIGEENAINVVNLKVTGSINSYDVMVFRNKMLNLHNLDLSDATIVASSYKYYNNQYYTKDNVITGYFGTPSLLSITLPDNITALDYAAFRDCSITSIVIPESVVSIGSYVFSGCGNLQSATLPNGITEIPRETFNGCRYLRTINLPSGVTSIGDYAFYGCSSLTSMDLPKGLKTIGSNAFSGCSNLSAIKLPPYVSSLGTNAFNGCSKLNTIYVYIPDYTLSVNEGAFSTYTTATLKIPAFLYKDYYYSEGGWKRFLNIVPCDLQPGDYESLPTNSDTSISNDDEIIPNISENEPIDGEIFEQGSITVTDNVTDTQEFDTIEQNLNGEGQGGSLIGTDTNLSANTLRVKINVKAGRWYFFCFPFDVTISNCEYPGQYAWRYYDGAYRASNGSGGWKPVAGETLNALEGYAFQSSHAGNLIVTFNHPTFGGNRPQTLVAHACENAANASWNLVGNPYSCFYDFLDDAFTSPITVYNNGTYTAYRPGDDDCHLQPYQAFFVQKPIDVDLINFVPGHRESYRQSLEAANGQQQRRRARGINPERLLINLEIMSDDNMIDRTRVVFNEKAQHAYELECDASKFISNDAVAQLYSVENGMQMAINERPLEGDIRLGYIAKHAGTLSISAPRMDMPMMLVDSKLGISFDLSVGTYEFETTAGTFNNRFYLRLSGDATAINNLKKETGVCIGTQIGGIAIGGAEGKTVNVYSTNGAEVASQTGNGYIALKSGIYVVNVDGTTAKVSVK